MHVEAACPGVSGAEQLDSTPDEPQPSPEIPDCWPPPEDEPSKEQRLVVPLFPLPRVWLHPAIVLPLHIFEPRYRSMIEDILDGPGRLVLGTVLPEHERAVAGAPPCFTIAGLGEIGSHQRLDDGRFQIMLVGLARVSIRELESEHAYRLVEATPLEETAESEGEREELWTLLEAALQKRSPAKLKLPREAPVARLADLLLMHLPLEANTRQQLYSELSIADRARAILEQHEGLPAPQLPPAGQEPEQDAGEPGDESG